MAARECIVAGCEGRALWRPGLCSTHRDEIEADGSLAIGGGYLLVRECACTPLPPPTDRTRPPRPNPVQDRHPCSEPECERLVYGQRCQHHAALLRARSKRGGDVAPEPRCVDCGKRVFRTSRRCKRCAARAIAKRCSVCREAGHNALTCPRREAVAS